MNRTSWVSLVAVLGGALLLGLTVILPWAYVAGAQVGIEWVGLQAIIPTVLLGAAAIVAVVSPRLRRWTVLAASLVGLFAGYGSLAMARAIPTMAAVQESAEGKRGPAFLAILASEALFMLAAWGTLLPRRARDISER